VKSDELIKKKGAIAFGVYGIESNDRKSKLTNPVHTDRLELVGREQEATSGG
jgi:hypothetical protein